MTSAPRPATVPSLDQLPPHLAQKLRNMPAWLRDSIINPKGTTK